MNCPKCQGLVMQDYDEWKCINCGCRPFEVTRPAPVEPDAPPTRCACGKADKLPRRTICKHCLYARDARAQERKKRLPLHEDVLA